MWRGSRVASHDYTSRRVMWIVRAEEERSEETLDEFWTVFSLSAK